MGLVRTPNEPLQCRAFPLREGREGDHSGRTGGGNVPGSQTWIVLVKESGFLGYEQEGVRRVGFDVLVLRCLVVF